MSIMPLAEGGYPVEIKVNNNKTTWTTLWTTASQNALSLDSIMNCRRHCLKNVPTCVRKTASCTLNRGTLEEDGFHDDNDKELCRKAFM